MARPRFTLTSDQLEQLPKLAAVLSLEQLAYVYGITSRTLQRRMKDDPQFDVAYRRGHALMIADVAGALVKQALKGNVTACIFYLKCQAGWREADPRQIPVEDIPRLTEKELEREKRRLGLVKD